MHVFTKYEQIKMARAGFVSVTWKVNRDVVQVLGVRFARLEMNTVLYSAH